MKEFNLGLMLGKRIELISTTLRTRSDEFKSKLIYDFNNEILPFLESGKLKPIISKVRKVRWNEEAVEAFREFHQEMEENKNIGKLIIEFE